MTCVSTMLDNINALHYRANAVFDNTKNKACKQYSALWRRKIMMKLYDALLICQDDDGDTKFITIELNDIELEDVNEHPFDRHKYLPEGQMVMYQQISIVTMSQLN